MQTLHWRDEIIRASRAGDMRRIDQLARNWPRLKRRAGCCRRLRIAQRAH